MFKFCKLLVVFSILLLSSADEAPQESTTRLPRISELPKSIQDILTVNGQKVIDTINVPLHAIEEVLKETLNIAKTYALGYNSKLMTELLRELTKKEGLSTEEIQEIESDFLKDLDLLAKNMDEIEGMIKDFNKNLKDDIK